MFKFPKAMAALVAIPAFTPDFIKGKIVLFGYMGDNFDDLKLCALDADETCQ